MSRSTISTFQLFQRFPDTFDGRDGTPPIVSHFGLGDCGRPREDHE